MKTLTLLQGGALVLLAVIGASAISQPQDPCPAPSSVLSCTSGDHH